MASPSQQKMFAHRLFWITGGPIPAPIFARIAGSLIRVSWQSSSKLNNRPKGVPFSVTKSFGIDLQRSRNRDHGLALSMRGSGLPGSLTKRLSPLDALGSKSRLLQQSSKRNRVYKNKPGRALISLDRYLDAARSGLSLNVLLGEENPPSLR